MRWLKTILKAAGLILAGLVLVACGMHIANSGQGTVPARDPGVVRIATHNVHYILMRAETGPWSVGDWERRKVSLDAAFKAMDADIVAFQEMESFEGGDTDDVNLAREYLLARNPGYAAAATGDWRQFPSTQPIFYRTSRFRVAGQGWFFFSDTPEAIYSRTFDGSWPAFAVWVEFERIADGQRFHVFNLHFEYRSRSNRHLSAALVRDRVAPVAAAGGPVFVAGDINDLRSSRTARILGEAGLTFAPVRGATYHMNRGVNVLPAIDQIAYAGPVALAGDPVVMRQRFAGEWPSDHYPVFADFRIGD